MSYSYIFKNFSLTDMECMLSTTYVVMFIVNNVMILVLKSDQRLEIIGCV